MKVKEAIQIEHNLREIESFAHPDYCGKTARERILKQIECIRDLLETSAGLVEDNGYLRTKQYMRSKSRQDLIIIRKRR